MQNILCPSQITKMSQRYLENSPHPKNWESTSLKNTRPKQIQGWII